MPPHDLLENALTLPLNHITMARDNPLEPPLINPLHTTRESLAITRTSPVPNGTLLPFGIALCALQSGEDFGQNTCVGVDARLAELLRGGQVEHEIGRDEAAGGAVVEHEFLVDVRGDVFPIEFRVEFGGDGGDGFRGAEDDAKGYVFVVLLCALLGKDIRTHDLGVGVFGVPGAEEDVVLLFSSVSRRRVAKGGRVVDEY